MRMDAELKYRINNELRILNHAKDEYTKRLDRLYDCRGSVLHRKKPGNGKYYYYYVKPPGLKAFKYLGRQSHPKVKRVREARYLEEAISRIDQDINLLEAVIDGFLPYDASSINESLPATYRCEVPPVSEQYEIEGKKWLSKRLEFQKRFPENYPERKKHRTSDGVWVKSISEVVLYEMIKSAGLIQVYELPLAMKDYGSPLYPDSTVLSPIDMKTEIIVEYVGMMDLMDYRGDFAKKVGRYIDSGYIPGVNLFFVYGDSKGHIDAMQITRLIAEIFGICNP